MAAPVRCHPAGGAERRPRSGRPPVFTAAGRAEVIALACALPAESGAPLAKWSCPELARELAARRQIAASASTIGRWLAADALKPWQHRSWISVRDPAFAAKAARVLDLYAGIWGGEPLGGNDYVICADEKTSIQARCRCHPTLPPGKARAMRVEHDYQRGGALAYLAAWDVHRGQVIGRCEPTTGIAPFARLVEQVMTSEPYASADRVFWIVDNGSSHRGAASIQRMTSAWPTAHLIHLPARASWLDQAEIYFSVVQRKALTPHRLHQPGPDPRPPGRLRDPLQRHRQAIRLEIHPRRPPRPAAPHRRSQQSPAPRPGSMKRTPGELTGQTT